MPGLCVRLLVGLFVALPCHVLWAQSSPSVPPLMRFDGVFMAADGRTTGTETVELAVYDAESGGTRLWEETQVVTVDAGRYSVMVGASTTGGLPAAVLAGDRWLELRFSRGAAPVPRVRMTSVPYALRAADADTLRGLPASAFLRADSPAAADGADPAAGAAGREATPRVNTGTPGYLGRFTNVTDLTSSVMFENAGRLGVGTTTPADVLHVRFTDGSGSFTGYAVQNLSSAATAYSGMLFYDQNGNLGQFQGFNNVTKEYRINNIAPGGSINFMLNSTPRFTVAAQGIGIGTVAPQDPIDIASGFVRAGAGFRMAGPNIFTGLTQESSSQILNIGVNDGRAGAHLLGTNGGFFRVDSRSNQPLFQWYSKETTVGQEDRRMWLNSDGTFFVPGVRSTTVSSSPVAVLIDANGQLGIATSSRRYKEDIRDMGEASSGLMALRPVTYRYRDAGGGVSGAARPVEYGLIAEEVADVYPDLVAHLANGEIETVQYHKVNAMLLNEVQKQHRQIEAQHHELDALRAELEALKRLVTEPSGRTAAPVRR